MTGSFAFRGDWFGRPFGHQHRIVDAVDLLVNDTERPLSTAQDVEGEWVTDTQVPHRRDV